jgi:hypothetical protein
VPSGSLSSDCCSLTRICVMCLQATLALQPALWPLLLPVSVSHAP